MAGDEVWLLYSIGLVLCYQFYEIHYRIHEIASQGNDNTINSLSPSISKTLYRFHLFVSTTPYSCDSIVPFSMSASDVSNGERAVADAYIALSDYVVEFPKEVSDYFVSKLGEEEFRKVCNLACQAPP